MVIGDDRVVALVRITGKVQGVGFRIWTRNEADGSVLALITGPDAAASAMMTRFWQGPAGASVSSAIEEPTPLVEGPADFVITG
ncbi:MULTISPECIES: acylphosphatase [Rhizobium]|uniref:Acylphosphatase n=1 Tax=Rhizobium paranaense TaxID=1650438 RepID=A0A7W8XXY3_9HYPH|nr:acylphosphatase [Rhizobium paranaense]MBB5577619.1 acylphosphatase [Rhizobium paranaense]